MQNTQLYDLLKLSKQAQTQINYLLMTPQQSMLRATVLQMCELITLAVIDHEKRENEQEKLDLIPNVPAPTPANDTVAAGIEGAENA